MASAWGTSWGTSWGDSWGTTGGGGGGSGITTVDFNGFAVLGPITVGTTPIALKDLFSNLSGVTVATIIFCTHESNGAGTVIYIGDLTMTSDPTTATLSLLGPNVVDKSLANPKSLNTVPLGNVKIMSSVANQAVRISVLIS